MKVSRWLLLALFLLPFSAFGQAFSASLNGLNEVPPADLDGTGNATIQISGTTISYVINVANITIPPTAQHIHIAPAGVNGPIVVGLTGTWVGGTLSGSVTTTAAIAAAIIANPAGHYVNVHNTDFPGGAVRGQLGAVSTSVPALGTGAVITLALLLVLGAALLMRGRSTVA